jgi:hypothetical protein
MYDPDGWGNNYLRRNARQPLTLDPNRTWWTKTNVLLRLAKQLYAETRRQVNAALRVAPDRMR